MPNNLPEIQMPENTGDFPADGGELILFIGAIQVSHEKSWALTIPLRDTEDNQPIEIPIKTMEQREFINRWIAILDYAGAEVSSSDGGEGSVVVDPKVSWHELLFRNLRGKSQLLITPDELWSQYSSLSVALVERFSRRIRDSFQIKQFGK